MLPIPQLFKNNQYFKWGIGVFMLSEETHYPIPSTLVLIRVYWKSFHQWYPPNVYNMFGNDWSGFWTLFPDCWTCWWSMGIPGVGAGTSFIRAPVNCGQPLTKREPHLLPASLPSMVSISHTTLPIKLTSHFLTNHPGFHRVWRIGKSESFSSHSLQDDRIWAKVEETIGET